MRCRLEASTGAGDKALGLPQTHDFGRSIVEAIVGPKAAEQIYGPAAAATSGSIPIKPGAGKESPYISRVLAALTGVSDIQEVTSMDDGFHRRFNSAHSKGRAVDLTIKDPSQSAAAAAKIRSALESAGIPATVIDEYLNPSAHATGGHIHIGAAAAAAAARHGSAYGQQSSISHDHSSKVEIAEVNVHAPNARTNKDVADAIGETLRRQTAIAAWNTSVV